MKILQVTEATSQGVGMHVTDLCRELAQQGHEIHLIYSPVRMDGRFAGALAKMPDVRQFSCPLHRKPHPHDLQALRYIRNYLKKHGPFDILHGHSSKGGALVRLVGWDQAGATIYTPNAFITQNPLLSRSERWFYRLAEQTLAKLTDGIIVVSPEELEHARQVGLSARLCYIPNGVEPPRLPTGAEVRHRLGLNLDDLLVGFVGRLEPQKAPDVLLRAFAILREKLPMNQLKLMIVGEGSLKPSLVNLAGELGITAQVRWLGAVSGQEHMPAFDLLVLPSHYEGMPYVLVEALFAGLPIVATAVAGTKVTVEPGVNGFLVPSGNPKVLALAIGELLQRPERRRAFGQASLKKSIEFTLERMISRTLEHYTTLVESMDFKTHAVKSSYLPARLLKNIFKNRE
jgi:glycosyltransferase involved in cell wall biosynthesis